MTEELLLPLESPDLFALYSTSAECLRASIIECVDTDTLIVATRSAYYSIALPPAWHYITSYADPGMIIHIIGVQIPDKSLEPSRSNTSYAHIPDAHSVIPLICTPSTCFILLPDILINATTIADSMKPNGVDYTLTFIKKFTTSQPTLAILRGSVVNTLFDTILEYHTVHKRTSSAIRGDVPSFDIDAALRHALSSAGIGIAYLFRDTNNIFSSEDFYHFLNECRTIAQALYLYCSTLELSSCTLEPTFFSPLYGIQGRLDLLMESDTDHHRKDIIELKASAPFNNTLSAQHHAQTICYDILLHSCYPDRIGTNSILYAKAKTSSGTYQPHAIEAAYSISMRNHILLIRNMLTLFEWRIAQGNFSDLVDLRNKQPHSALFEHENNSILSMRNLLLRLTRNTDVLEKEYFKALLQSIAKQQIHTKIGLQKTAPDMPELSSVRLGFSALWRSTLTEKQSDGISLAYLIFDESASDLVQQHLQFSFTNATAEYTTLRIGDRIILYSVRQASPITEPIAKGTIIALDATTIRVSLQNKNTHTTSYLQRLRTDQWAIEPDILSSDNESPYKSLFDFFATTTEELRNCWLGQTPPHFDTTIVPRRFSDLTDEQYALLTSAVRAQHYFLLQGPPGTGKTSRMVKSIIRHYMLDTTDCIILTACTNRAVQEMCEAFMQLPEAHTIPSLRLSSKYGGITTSTDIVPTVFSLYQEAEHIDDFARIAERIHSVRLIFTTVASLHRHKDIFHVKTFQRLIVDEASQLTETDILGFVPFVQSTILIGDQCQLPAVVSLTEEDTMYAHQRLQTAGLYSSSMSLFERLIRQAESRQWDAAYGMLRHQARMHTDIQNAVNRMFYNNQLHALHDDQHLSYLPQRYHIDSLPHVRCLFIDTPTEQSYKYNYAEAELTAQLAEEFYRALGDDATDHSIGIISPFRMQNNAIKARLPQALRSHITVDTVERFQGSERDIIIISCAVNEPSHVRSIQSLSLQHPSLQSPSSILNPVIDRKLNVAITRARQRCIIIGNYECLTHPELVAQHYHEYITYTQSLDGFLQYSAEEKKFVSPT